MEKEALGLNGDERLNVIGSIIEVIYESVEVMEVRRDATNIRAFVLIRVFFFVESRLNACKYHPLIRRNHTLITLTSPPHPRCL